MENILFLDDFINYYDRKNNIIINFKPYKKTLKKGIIQDSQKFLKSFNNLKKIYKLTDSIFNDSIILIINSNYSVDDKHKIKEILEELNYKNIKIKNEIEFLKINKNNIYINYNESYINIYYLENNKIKINNYENNFVNKSLVINIIKKINKKNVIVFGKQYKEIIKILEKSNINYYYYEDNNNLYIKMLLKSV